MRIIIELAYLAVLVYVWLIVAARAILSWVRPRPGTTRSHRVEKALVDVTEPYVGCSVACCR